MKGRRLKHAITHMPSLPSFSIVLRSLVPKNRPGACACPAARELEFVTETNEQEDATVNIQENGSERCVVREVRG